MGEFDKLHIPVHEIKANNISLSEKFNLDIYPEFRDFDKNIRADQKLSKNKVIRYIVYMYDMNSPLQEMNGITSRRNRAAELAGWEKKDDRFGKSVEDILMCRISHVNKMIIRYARIQKDSDWATLVTYEDSLYTQLDALRNNSEGKETKDILQNIEELRKSITNLKRVMLEGDDNSNLTHDLYDTIENESLEFRPEDIAKKIKSGEYVKRNTVRLSEHQ